MFKRPLVTVGGLIIAPDGDILLVRAKKWHDLYSLPGGKVEWGETREMAFKREILEETNLNITNIRFAIVQDCIFSSEFWQKKHFIMNDFIADLDPRCKKDQVRLNHEAYHFCWMSPRQALALNLHKECRFLIEWYLKELDRISQKNLGMIGIHQHEVHCIVGIYPEERQNEQLLLINLKIKIDLANCQISDQIKDTLDYSLLARICTKLAKENKYYLLETFAFDILKQSIENFGALWAWVHIEKPAAIPTAKYAYVEVERYRGEN